MNDTFDGGKRRAPIVPTARRNIHDYEGYVGPLNREIMGRYGLQNRAADTAGYASTSQFRKETGCDEVDNVMSKHLHKNSSSPLSPKKINVRRSSLTTQNNQYTDDSDVENNVLAKSLPAILPSYCSDELGNGPGWNETNYDGEQPAVIDTSTTSNSNITSEFIPHSADTRNNDRSNLSSNSSHSTLLASFESYETGSVGNGQFNMVLIVGIIVLLVAGVAAYYIKAKQVTSEEIVSKYVEDKFYHDIESLGRKYKITDSSILKVKTGISTIFEKEDTGSFIFIYNSKNGAFDQKQFDDFMASVANAAARYLRNNSDTPTRHVLVEKIDLNMRTHTELINKYRDDLEKNAVMLVKEVGEVPSNLAMAFHYYCDEYNPLAKKSAVFFTLDSGKCSNISERKQNGEMQHGDIEKCLASKWEGVPRNKISALLTRVVSIVLDLSHVF